MIVKVFNNNQENPECYAFKQQNIFLGRNPPSDISVIINSKSISRNHLQARIEDGSLQIMDLDSSNGTFVTQSKIDSNIWINISPSDKIRLAEFQGYIKFQIRQENTISKKNKSLKQVHLLVKKKKPSKSPSSESDRSRSRQKPKNQISLPFKISQSTFKMLKDMTTNRKTKQERIKFLKLMGVGKVQEYWNDIQSMLKQKKGIKDIQRTNDDLEKQFSQSRGGMEKKGLGN